MQICDMHYNDSCVSLVEPPHEGIPARPELRRLLDALLPGDSDLNGFVYDHYPAVLANYHPGLDRVAKLDLLLEHVDPGDLVRRLRERGLHGRTRRASEVFNWSSERQRNAEVFGRQPVLEVLAQAIASGGWVVLSGRSGVGKTALLVQLLNALEEHRGRPVPHHFLRHTIADSSRPGVVLRALSAQIEALFPHLVDPDAPPELRLVQLLSRVSRQGLENGDDLILIVDGLDEVEAEGLSNPLPRFLPPELPPGVTLVCSIDAGYPHYGWLMDHAEQQLGGHIDLDGNIGRSSTESACRALVMRHAPHLGLSESQCEQVALASAGNLLCATKLLEVLYDQTARNVPLERALRDMSIGLDSLLSRLWQSLSNEGRAALGLLCAARQALPLTLLDDLLGLEEGESAEHLVAARPFLYTESAAALGIASLSCECVSFAHCALRDFVASVLGPTSLHQSQRLLGASLCSWPPLEDNLYAFRRSYALRHAITQHIDSDSESHASQVISNIDFLVARCQEHGSAALAEDLEHAAACSNQPETARTFSDLAQALRIGAHWLAHDPGALPGLLYNLLRCANWTASTIERVLNFPPMRLRFRLAHPLQRRDTSVHTFAGHWDSVVSSELTPDGKRLISVGLDHTLRLWDLNSGAQLMHFYGHAGAPTALAVTSDGQNLLYPTSDHSLCVYDLSNGAQLRRLRGHSAAITACSLHPDGKRVLTAARDHKLKLWNLQTGEELATLSGHTGAITACLITRDGKRAISAGWDHSVRIWDLASGKLLHALHGHQGAVSALHLLPDDQHVVSASWDHSLMVWQLSTGARRAQLTGHSAPINAVVATADGRFLISASDDRTLKVWDTDSGRELRTLIGHHAGVKGCVLLPDSRSVISVSEDWTLRQWDLSTGAPLRMFDGHLAPALACSVTRDGRQLISASEDKTLKLWDLSPNYDSGRSDGHIGAVTACFLSEGGGQLVTASEDQTIKVWDPHTGAVQRTLIGHSEAVTACALFQDGRRFVSTSPDGTTVVWDLPSGSETLRIVNSALARKDRGSQPSGAHLAIPSDDHMIELWGMPLDSPRRAESSMVGRIRTCAVTRDSRYLITGAGDRLLRLWDLNTGAELLRFAGHSGAVNSCALLPDGKRLLSASSDRLLIVWQLETGNEVLRLSGHTGAVNACTVSADGRRALSGGYDKTLRLWDLSAGNEVIRLIGHTAPITSCLITDDGRRAISASLDYTLRIWDLMSGMCIETIYGSSAYLCLAAVSDWLVAGDQAGNVWILRDQIMTTPSTEARLTRQSLMESVRKFLSRSSSTSHSSTSQR